MYFAVYRLTLNMNGQLSSESYILLSFFSEPSHAFIFYAGEIKWIWQVMWIFEPST